MATAAGYANCSVMLKQNLMARPAFITFGVKPTDTNPDQIAASVYTAVTTTGSLKSIMDTDVTIGPVTVHYGIDGSEDIVGTTATTTTGGRSVSAPPPNVALLVIKRTTRGGKRGKGRIYIPWCFSNAFIGDNGIIQSTEVVVMQTAMSAFITALTSNTVPMYILHKPSDPSVEHPTTAGAPNLVTNLQVQSLVATQRRRLDR